MSGPEVDIFIIALERLPISGAIHVNALQQAMVVLTSYQPLVDGEVELHIKAGIEPLVVEGH